MKSAAALMFIPYGAFVYLPISTPKDVALSAEIVSLYSSKIARILPSAGFNSLQLESKTFQEVLFPTDKVASTLFFSSAVSAWKLSTFINVPSKSLVQMFDKYFFACPVVFF